MLTNRLFRCFAALCVFACAPWVCASDGPLSLRQTSDAIEIASTQRPSWRINLDLKQGGVATALHLPSSGPNLLADKGGFSGLFNLFSCDAKPGAPGAGPDGGLGKTLLKGGGTVESAKVLSQSANEIVVEIRGSTKGWRVPGPKDQKILQYRQTYTFRPDRAIVDGEITWVLGYDSQPKEHTFLSMFREGVVNPPLRILKTDGLRIPLTIATSGGSPFLDGFKHPIAMELALRNGQRIVFRTISVPDLWNECPQYKFERPWQTDWNQSFGLGAYCTTAWLPANKPIPYQYEVEFPGGFSGNNPPLAKILSPARMQEREDEEGIGSGQFFKPGATVKLTGTATDREDGKLKPMSCYWQVFRGGYVPIAAGAGTEFSVKIPNDIPDKTLFWVRFTATDSNGWSSEDYVTFAVKR